jgi:hypothetical protein
MDQDPFRSLLIRAKQNTYASGNPATASSRPQSHDLDYSEGRYHYIDTYLGGFHFIGEEAVWENDIPVWGMNYYGKMLVEEIPQRFGEFLKAALLRVPKQAPYRGPADYQDNVFSYHCSWEGELMHFQGWEEIAYQNAPIYRLVFHGGEIRAE